MSDSTTELPARQISELVANPEFPRNALGVKVDIKGSIGVVVDIVKNSIKVRLVEGNTLSYNFHALRKLYGPRPEPESPADPAPEPAAAAAATEPKREVILQPDFDAPLVPIEQLVPAADFPKNAFGRFIDLHGYEGVVVELVGRSLKVRSRQGSTRSYNADGLRKIYGQPTPIPPA